MKMTGPATEALERAIKRRRTCPGTCNHTLTDLQSSTAAVSATGSLAVSLEETDGIEPSQSDASTVKLQSKMLESSFTFDDAFHILSGIDNKNHEKFPTIEWKFTSTTDLQGEHTVCCQKDYSTTSSSKVSTATATVSIKSSCESYPRPP
jgi:hypothetical protein